MALDLIGVGTTANDGTGDPLRTAFQKTNLGLDLLNDHFVDDDFIPNVSTGTKIIAGIDGTFKISGSTGFGDEVEIGVDLSGNASIGASGAIGDLLLKPTGLVRFGTFTDDINVIANGYIEFKTIPDGVTRKLLCG